MATKMKGLFKGLRYISQIFEEDKEEEMQIGLPTDVKHVAHIGWDGPSQVGSSPSWMKEFKASEHQSAPLDSNGKIIDDPEIKWVSEDSKKGNRAADSPENNSNESPRKKSSSTKSGHSRRNHSKDSSEGSIKSGQDESGRPDSPSRAHPYLAKKSRRKKSKETEGGGSTRSRSKDSDGGSSRSRSKDSEGGSTRSRSKYSEGGSTRSRSKDSEGGSTPSRFKHTSCGASAYSDSGQDTGSIDEEKERRVMS